MLSLESTTWPGTTEEGLRPFIEERGLTIGEDFFLVYSPEREDPGNPNYTTHTIPKVVGGSTHLCLKLGERLYQEAVEQVVPVSSTRAAELTKLLENIHRAVNIGLVNEMKIIANKMGIDIFEVIDAAATKPFGFTPYYPGPGLGGHCIPIDPFYLTWKSREFGLSTHFIELAGEVNRNMPEWVVDRIAEALNDREKSIKGDGQSAGYVFGTLGPKALSLTSCGREKNRTTGFPEINKAGVWKLDLRVNSSEISEVAQEFFVAWEPGQAPMLLPAPTESRSVLSSHDDARTETAGTGGGFTSVPAWRKQLVSSVRIRLRPIFPQIYESDELIVRDVTDEWLSIEKPGSGQGFLLPCSRVLGVVRMSDGDPYVVDLNGRMQLITSTRSWRFFLERPDTPDERRFGLCKVSSLKDPKAIAIIDKLTSFGIESRFTSLRNIGDRTAQGWQIVYDEDGRYFRVSRGGGDDLVLMACFAK